MDKARSVLIVDDDSGCRELFRRAVSGMGHAPIAAAGEAEAFECLRRSSYDAVITDVCLERADAGLRLAEEAERRSPGTPVILITGRPGLETAVPALRAGVCDYLTKPFTLADLEGALTRALAARRVPSTAEELGAAYQELQKVERLREATYSIINHELRTPLFAALMASEQIAREHPEGGPVQDILRDNLERLQKSMEDFLLHVRLATGRAPERAIDVEPATLLVERVKAAGEMASERGQSIDLTVAGEPRFVRADRELLARAIDHLLSNAVRFNREGGRVSVRLEFGAERLSLMVSDEGEGVALSDRERIFDPYYQVADFLTRRHGGLGLGLAIVRSVFEGLGGSVRADGQLGKGCRFTAEIPY